MWKFTHDLPRLDAQEQHVVGEIEGLSQKLALHLSRLPEWTNVLRRNQFARAIKGSSALAGYSVSLDDAVLAIDGELQPLEADADTWTAVVSLRNAMTYVCQLAASVPFKDYYGPQLLTAINFIAMNHEPGRRPGMFRSGPSYVREGGAVLYEGPEADQIPELIAELCEQLGKQRNQERFGPAIVCAVLCRLNILMIRPFMDGNDRTARCVQTLILAREGMGAAEFCGVEEWLAGNIVEYRQAFKDVAAARQSPAPDIKPWLRFYLKAYFQQGQAVFRRAKLSQALWAELEELAQRMDLPDRAIPCLFNGAIGLKIRNSGYRRNLKISQNVAGYDLKLLTKRGLLVAHGSSGGRFYEPGQPIKELVTRIANSLPRISADPFAADGLPDRA